jgi:predicted amidohydrolase YtcJ
MKALAAEIFAIALLVVAGLIGAPSAWSQSADTLLLNGKILTVDDQFSTREALAIREGRIVALGASAEIRKFAGPKSRVIDLQGRTVIPGLIDSHIHAIRAGLSFSTEVNWIGAATLSEALGRIREVAHTLKPGAWLIVAGGWSPQQFAEKRRPTQAELMMAAPDNPVYVQLGYGWAVMTPLALRTVKISTDADVPPHGKFEKDSNGNLTGAIAGDMNCIVALFAKLPTPTYEQSAAGTQKFFRELNRLAITGVVDPGGSNLSPEAYQPLFKIWRDGKMTVRVAFSIFAQNRGAELADYQSLTKLLPMGFGDDMLHFNGIGEQVTLAMYNNDSPSDADKAQFYEAAKWAAQRGMSLTIHWRNDRSVGELLTVFERVNKEAPITGLRWSIAHLDDASEGSLGRMKALGVGWTVQDAEYFDGDAFVKREGAAAARRVPAVVTAEKMGVAVGAGTDAHRVASYNPFTSLRWFLDGKTVGGDAIRGPEETPSRADALRFYTLGSAWFSHDDARRGSLVVGKLADLAVLSKDYMTVPVEEVASIESLLTMVGGKIVYAAGPYSQLDEAR